MVCLQEDDFTEELQTDRAMALWQAELSNGQVVTMDDGRPGEKIHSAWIRLKMYLAENNLTIRKIKLKFRSNVKEGILAEGADGYFFSKGSLGLLFSDSVLNFYLIGVLQEGKVMVQRWKVPELILIEEEQREPIENDSLILCK